jgi:hypothetical protein
VCSVFKDETHWYVKKIPEPVISLIIFVEQNLINLVQIFTM